MIRGEPMRKGRVEQGLVSRRQGCEGLRDAKAMQQTEKPHSARKII